MALIKPKTLQPGDTLGIVAPASGQTDDVAIDQAIDQLRSMGFRVKPGRALRGRHGFLAATDVDRLRDLHNAFANPAVDAIMCMRGGYGTQRLLSGIDYRIISANPKLFIGYSDITALNLAFLASARLISFNGPMAVSTFARKPISMFATEGFLRTTTIARAAGSIWTGHADEEAGERQWRIITPGQATGQLVGGNLSLLASLVGTPWHMHARGKIVFLEEIDEKPYSIDRMLTQLIQGGGLAQAAGIVIGRNMAHPDCLANEESRAAAGLPHRMPRPPRRMARDAEQTMDDVFAERLGNLGIPVMSGLPFGHIADSATLPIGVRASMDTRTGELTIDESAVKNK
ncbi:LD-carboxypeptidase [candidate division BRC1 bacterium HGW-BRC1-1]|jgi:muramoyltetrapeptide carboxypeptidase|nr:MAG: LD-carboxypeptidase [candidate division BRC1 bacterium HGW-BRC1-1]